jgi:hypothetical protein
MREGYKSSGASEARGSGAGERRHGAFPTGVGRRVERGESDRWGLIDRDEGEAAGSGRRDPKGKTYFPRRRD